MGCCLTPILLCSSCEDETHARRIVITAAPEIVADLEKAAAREAALVDFLAEAGWGGANAMPLPVTRQRGVMSACRKAV